MILNKLRLRRSVSAVQICFLFAVVSCVSCGGGPGNLSSQISLSASVSQVVVGQFVLLTATVPGNPNAKVNWAVDGIPNGNSTVGMILASTVGGPTPTNALSARYASPLDVPSSPVVTISATLQSDVSAQGSAVITIGPNITISPALPEVPTYGMQQFTATVAGESNATVTWQISCAAGGSACGAISQTGLYKAPNSVPTVFQNGSVLAQDVNLTATAQAAPLFSEQLGIVVVPRNSQTQTEPILLGTSGSNVNDFCTGNGSEGCGGGTLGSLVVRDGVEYTLTNWHVAVATDGGVIGDAVVQPGLIDAQCDSQQTTTVANLSQLLNPQTETGDKVDVAIAKVVSGAVDPTGAILELGSSVVNGVPQPGAPAGGPGTPAFVGELVAKSGRSTGLTCASVQSIATSINIIYTNQCSTTTFNVAFSGQVVVADSGFLAAGDSGSLIVDQKTAEPVALLFAGDANSATGNPVSDVLAALKDSNGNVATFVGGPEHTVAACSIAAPTANAGPPVARLSPADMQSAIAIKEKHVSQLMNDPAVQGVGVGASQDAANVPALIVYVLKNSVHAAIPATIEGLAVRIIETTGFHAGNSGTRNHACGAQHPRSALAAPQPLPAPSRLYLQSRRAVSYEGRLCESRAHANRGGQCRDLEASTPD
jgi:hypothetical protein